jgi:hypothetical protein
VRAAGGIAAMFSGYGKPRFDVATAFYLAFIALLGTMIAQATAWPFGAKIVPLVVGSFTVAMAIIGWLNHIFRRPETADGVTDARQGTTQSLHLDLAVDDAGLETRTMLKRAVTFLAWLLGFLVVVALIGMLPTVFLFVILYMRVEGPERWTLALPISAALTLFTYVLFDRLLALPWPRTVLGDWFPALQGLIPSV